MPRFKRRHVLLAAIVIAVSVGGGFAGAAIAQNGQEQHFRDVPIDHYAFDAINWMVDNNITTGCGDGTNFCPDRALNRAHLSAFLYRYHHNVVLPYLVAVYHEHSTDIGTGSKHCHELKTSMFDDLGQWHRAEHGDGIFFGPVGTGHETTFGCAY